MNAVINFYNTERFHLDFDEQVISKWMLAVINFHGFKCSELNFTLYTDQELLELNNEFLGHDFFTDIITFDNTIHKTISADVALSYDRIKENAVQQKIDFDTELKRVMIHGVLHCMGLKDDTNESKRNMRIEEDKALHMFHVEQKLIKDNV